MLQAHCCYSAILLRLQREQLTPCNRLLSKQDMVKAALHHHQQKAYVMVNSVLKAGKCAVRKHGLRYAYLAWRDNLWCRLLRYCRCGYAEIRYH